MDSRKLTTVSGSNVLLLAGRVYTQLLRDRWLFAEAIGAVDRMDQRFSLPGRCLKERWGKRNREIAGLGAVRSEV